MSLIQVSHLTFAYDGSYDNVFEDLSFQIDTDWKLGFTGRNGRGKTTFLRLLMGDYEYRGQIASSVRFSYFPRELRHPDWLAWEALEELEPGLERWRLLREMARLELEEDVLYRPFDSLSHGERTKLLLALQFLQENGFPLIDEPTNHLDIHGREVVSRYLNGKKGFLLVSHDRAFLDGCVDHILSINKASIDIQKGSFSSWWENKRRQDAFELAENDKLKKEIGRLRETAREKAQWSDTAESRKTGISSLQVDNVKGWRPLQGAKSKKQMARAKAIETRREAAIEEKEKLLKNIEHQASLKLSQAAYHKERLLEVRDLTVNYGNGELFTPLSFELLRGDRLALLGRNGSGKSSILKLLCGGVIPYSGSLEKGSGLTISYVPQDPGDLCGDLADYARRYAIDESLFKAILIKLDFARKQFEKDMADFSAGQKKKVLIARSLCEKSHLHIWDEPMNYIDVISRMQIEELILEHLPTLIFVEHDRAFCGKVATKSLELKR